MTDEQKWEQINARKRKDICWVAAWNQAANMFSGRAMEAEDTVKLVEALAKELFSRMYAPYQKEEEIYLENGKPIVNEVAAKQPVKRDFPQTVNIDSEVDNLPPGIIDF